MMIRQTLLARFHAQGRQLHAIATNEHKALALPNFFHLIYRMRMNALRIICHRNKRSKRDRNEQAKMPKETELKMSERITK